MSRSLITAALLAALVAPAQADVWKQATNEDPSADFFNALIQRGDDAARAAAVQSMSVREVTRQVDLALESYRAAAKVRPTSPEPPFRIAALLQAFFFDCAYHPLTHTRPAPRTCDPSIDRDARATEMIEAWEKLETIAPLDPRVNEMLQARAIERTKMVARSKSSKDSTSLLEGAKADYNALLDRNDGIIRLHESGRLALVLGNLAETYMMLGDIDRATETYIAAHNAGADGTTLLGLAVALDRDEQGAEALRLIRHFGIDNFRRFKERLEDNEVFFVPAGEEQYYLAICSEAFGEIAESIEHWKKFIRSGAHPQFQDRAKAHLQKLTLRKNFQFDTPATDLGREPAITPLKRVPPMRRP